MRKACQYPGRMRRRTAALAAFLLFACDGEEPVSHDAPIEVEAEPLPGEALYRRYCALCHGRDGEGYAADDAPALSNQEFLRSASDQFITQAIVSGRPTTPMSAWSDDHGGPLDDEQIAQIVAYMRSWQRDEAVSVDEVELSGVAARGAPIFQRRCATCHGARGEGVDAIALANPALLATASDGFLQYAIQHGRRGTRMPAFEGTLEQEDIADLVAFIRTLGAPPELPHPPENVNVPPLREMQLVINERGTRARFNPRDERYVPAAQVKAELERGARMIVIDARSTSDWLTLRIPGAVPIPFYELEGILDALPRDGTPMVAYCGCPHAASGRVEAALRERGFTNTYVLDEGIGHWQSQGYPTASGNEQP